MIYDTKIKPMYNIDLSNTFYEDLLNNFEGMCNSFHLYGKIVPYHLNTLDPRRGHYAVASLQPIPENINPIIIVEKISRHESIFYPKIFAIRLDNDSNLIVSFNELLTYCREAEFLAYMCKEHNVSIPEKIRRDELYPMIDFNYGAKNKSSFPVLRDFYGKRLEEYFNSSFPKSGLKKEKMDFYRDEKYDSEVSFIKAHWDFAKRKKQNVSLDVLFRGSTTVKRITIPEFQFIELKNILEKKYPDILYHMDKIEITNHGDVPEGELKGIKSITYEEYYKILEARFASEQYSCINDVVATYFEDRTIYFKESDESTILGIVRNMQTRYAKAESIYTLMQNGDINVIGIPNNEFMNFASIAKFNKLKFAIDNYGFFTKPNNESINIVYLLKDEEFILSVLNRLIEEEFEWHSLTPNQLNNF